MLGIAGWLIGCRCEEPPPPEPPKPAWSPPTTIEDVRVLDASATGGVSLELRFTNISALHRRFFSDPELMAELSEALAPCVDGVAPVVITVPVVPMPTPPVVSTTSSEGTQAPRVRAARARKAKRFI